MLIVLLDADVIIDLHRFGIWKNILEKNKILIPSTILRREVFYFTDTSGIRHYIGLIDDAGYTFTEVSTTAEDLIQFKQKFDRFVEEELDPGETEALTILNDRKDCLFCTCDKAAIKVIALIGKREQGISFEKLLTLSGITKKLEPKHSENYFRKYLEEGSIMRIQRFGLKNNEDE